MPTPTIRIDLDGEGLTLFGEALAALGNETKARTALRRAVNKASAKAYTQVKRSLARQAGVPQTKVVRYGQLQRIPASGRTFASRIVSSGGYVPLKHFRARPGRRGVSAAPWGTRRLFGSTFIVSSLGGQVFKRLPGSRGKIEKLWGPAIPRELIQGETARAFEETAAAVLQPELARQIRGLSTGAWS